MLVLSVRTVTMRDRALCTFCTAQARTAQIHLFNQAAKCQRFDSAQGCRSWNQGIHVDGGPRTLLLGSLLYTHART